MDVTLGLALELQVRGGAGKGRKGKRQEGEERRGERGMYCIQCIMYVLLCNMYCNCMHKLLEKA